MKKNLAEMTMVFVDCCCCFDCSVFWRLWGRLVATSKQGREHRIGGPRLKDGFAFLYFVCLLLMDGTNVRHVEI